MSIRTYRKSEHKFFDDLVTMLCSLAGIFITADAFHNGGITNAPRDLKYYGEFEGSTLKLKFTFYPFEIFNKIINNEWPEEVIIHEDMPHEWGRVFGITTSAFKNLQILPIQASFIRYFENYRVEIEKIKGSDPYNWPEPWNFARVIRNASAHGGTIKFDNLDAKEVVWPTANLMYSPKDNDKKIFFTDFSVVEIVILMEEMDKALTEITLSK